MLMSRIQGTAMRQAIAPQKLKAVYTALAPHYDFQHGLLTLGADERGRRLAVEQTVRTGNKVLDAGTGTGSTALLAAHRVGNSGHVTLFDASPGMLEVARKKAEAEHLLDRVDFKSGDMLALPFADASFDAVLSTYSLCPLYDPEKGALELYRVLKPGGLMGIAHSASPEGPVMHWLAERLEDAIWPFPGLSMGCRAVMVLPALEKAGARLLFCRRMGMPLYPFLVCILKKPAPCAARN